MMIMMLNKARVSKKLIKYKFWCVRRRENKRCMAHKDGLRCEKEDKNKLRKVMV